MWDAAERHQQAATAIERLTPREIEVLRGLVTGGSNKTIGRTLGISPRTVEIHRANLKLKLGASCTADLVRIGLYAGIDTDETDFA